MSRLGSQLTKWKTAGGIAGFTVAAIVVSALPGVAVTNASWNDNEWDHGALGTEACASATNFSTRGASKLVGGTLLGTNLDNVASLNGVTVTNGAAGPVDSPAVTPAVTAEQNPLSVTALSAINLSLGSTLQLNTGNPVGVLNQYGQALQNGTSAGAAGAVDSSGAISLASNPPLTPVPTFATFDLASLANKLGIKGVANLTDVTLQLGAIASDAQLNACNALWTQNIYSNLTRNYGIAGLTTNITSPLLGNVVSDVNATTGTLTTAVNGIAGNSGLVNGVLGNVNTLIGPVATGLGLGTPTVQLSAAVNFGQLTTLLNTPISDSGGIVSINLQSGTIAVNTAALFNSTNGLNKLAPNTQLLINTAVINNLKTAITSALNNYVSQLTTAINNAISAITVNLAITLPAPGVLGAGGGISVTATNVSLASLVAGTAVLNAGFICNLANSTLCAVAEAPLNLVLSTLVAGLATSIEQPLGSAIMTVLNPAPLVATLTGQLNTLTAGIETLLATVLGGLFSPTSLLSIVVNAQNAPDPAQAVAGNPLPTWVASLPGPTSNPYATGQYDVSALQIVVAGAGGVTLDLARSSVGTNGLEN